MDDKCRFNPDESPAEGDRPPAQGPQNKGMKDDNQGFFHSSQLGAAKTRKKIGGEGGIRTHGPGVHQDNRLAGDPDRPLQHLSAAWKAGLF